MSEPGTESAAAPAPESSAPPVPWKGVDALLVILLMFLSGIVLYPLSEQFGVYAGVVLVIFSAVATIVLTLWLVRARYGVASLPLLWGHRRAPAMDALLGVGAAVVGQIGVSMIVGLLTLNGRAPAVQEELRQAAANPATLPLMALGAVLLIPIAEELLYRGLLFQGLRTRYGRWPAIGLSGFFFGLLHVQWGDLGGTLLLLAAFYPLGMWLAWVFDRRGSLITPIVCHVVYNGGNLALFLSTR